MVTWVLFLMWWCRTESFLFPWQPDEASIIDQVCQFCLSCCHIRLLMGDVWSLQIGLMRESHDKLFHITLLYRHQLLMIDNKKIYYRYGLVLSFFITYRDFITYDVFNHIIRVASAELWQWSSGSEVILEALVQLTSNTTTRRHNKVRTMDRILGTYCIWKYTGQVYSEKNHAMGVQN